MENWERTTTMFFNGSQNRHITRPDLSSGSLREREMSVEGKKPRRHEFGTMSSVWVKLKNGDFDELEVRRIDECNTITTTQEVPPTNWQPSNESNNRVNGNHTAARVQRRQPTSLLRLLPSLWLATRTSFKTRFVVLGRCSLDHELVVPTPTSTPVILRAHKHTLHYIVGHLTKSSDMGRFLWCGVREEMYGWR